MDELDELDIELRDPDDVGSRIVILTALCIWPDHETLEDRDSWADWLTREGILPLATRAELTAFMKKEDAKWSGVVRERKITAD